MTTTNELPPGIERKANDLPTDNAVGVHLPVGFRATSTSDGFTLVMKSRGVWLAFMVLFSLFWNGFMLLWFVIAIAAGAWQMAAFGSIHGLVGLVLGYITVRGLINRVELEVKGGVLTVTHKPLPWRAPPPVAREDIDQLFIVPDRNLRMNGRPIERYQLRLREKSGKEWKLLVTEQWEQARSLEQEIERAFNIVDRPIRDTPTATHGPR